jgi:GNAT superfamily N-acetyltransferase
MAMAKAMARGVPPRPLNPDPRIPSMSDQTLLEILGYVASVLVAISLMMRSILRLRLINLVGSLTFAVYGWLIGAVPVAVVNLFIAVINVYYLNGMLRSREFFRLLEVAPDSAYLRHFLGFYEDQIRRFLPHFAVPAPPLAMNLLVLRDMVPAGAVLGQVDGDSLRVELDFVIPQYRDFKVGKYLFEERADFWRDRGIRRIVSAPGNREHSAYLTRMGFRQPAGDAAADYALEIR